MKTVAIWVQKGGTGKSSTAGNLAWALRGKGKTLLVDADPQGNLSSWLASDGFKHELADVLAGFAPLVEAIRPVRDGLDILPTFSIGGELKEWAETKLQNKPQTFSRLIGEIASLGYSYCLFDLSPGASILERAIVASVDEALPVLRPEVFSIDGLKIFSAILEEVKADRGGNVAWRRTVVNGLNRSFAVHRGYIENLQKGGGEIYVIPQSVKITSAQTERIFLAEYAPADTPIPEYTRLAEAVA